MVCPALPTKQPAECRVIAYHVKMSKATCATPYSGKQPQYEPERFITSVGTLNRNAALFKMLIEMAFPKQFEEQGKTSKRGYLLVYELYVTITYQII